MTPTRDTMNLKHFNLYNKGSKLDQIFLCEKLDDRLRWYTGFRVIRKDWDNGLKASIHSQLKEELDHILTVYKEIKKQLGKNLTAKKAKYLLDCESIWKADNYISDIEEQIRYIPVYGEFMANFESFIDGMRKGTVKTSRGKKKAPRTAENFQVCYNTLVRFEEDTKYKLTWENINITFYERFTNYLWNDCNCFDGTVGAYTANIMTFLNWCVTKKIIPNKLYDANWILWKEDEVDALVLNPDELNLMHEMPAQGILDEVKDMYLFGCQTLLRVSNKLSLTESDLQISGDMWHLNPLQTKVGKRILIKLPPMAISILKKYRGKYPTLLPVYTIKGYEYWLRKLGKRFKEYMLSDEIQKKIKSENLITNDWSKPFIKIRYKQGQPCKFELDMSDQVKPHSERSTGTTTLLIRGVNPILVKKLGGWTKDSRAFGRYERIAQKFVEMETDQAWDKVFVNKLKVS